MHLLTRRLLQLVLLWWLELFNHVDEPRVLVRHIFALRVNFFVTAQLIGYKISVLSDQPLQHAVQVLAIVEARCPLLDRRSDGI